jgi:head-tail adaptor
MNGGIALSFGKLREIITIYRVVHEKDADGFAQPSNVPVATTRAYFEQRHGNVKWANRARFSEATALFRLRVIPSVSIEPLFLIVCRLKRYEVLSVEVLKGMYLEILCKGVEPLGTRDLPDTH